MFESGGVRGGDNEGECVRGAGGSESMGVGSVE